MTTDDLIDQAIQAIRGGSRRRSLENLRLVEARASRGDSVDHARLGVVYGWCQLPENAVPHLRAALRRNPSDHLVAYNLATMLRMTGDLAEAQQMAERLRASNRNFLDPVLLLSEVRTAVPDNNQVSLLDGWLRRSDLEARDKVRILYALAREYEDLGDDQQSFRMLQEGASLRRATMRYDVTEDIHVLDAIRQAHTRQGLSELDRGYDEGNPVFVVGLPRSGTTLVERTLASHADLVSVGESNAFAIEMVRLINARAGMRMGRTELVSATCSIDAAELGRSYCLEAGPDLERRAADDRAPRFIDKMPLNSLYLGLISKSLPAASLIILHRHPLDTVYAMYKSLFDGGYPFSYDLVELAQYYVAWRRLMDHFKEVLEDRLHAIDYEALVTSFDSEAMRLVRHVGVPWQHECLRPDLHSGASTTLSAVQVRQPIHARSVGRWQRFSQLKPAADVIQAAGYLG